MVYPLGLACVAQGGYVHERRRWSGHEGEATELVVMMSFLGVLNLLHANADGFNGRGDLVAESLTGGARVMWPSLNVRHPFGQ